MNSAMPAPMDVRLMNSTAMLLLGVFVVLLLSTAASWIARLSPFEIRGIDVLGDTTHNNALTLRANVTPQLAGTFLSIDLSHVREVFESVPWVRHAVVKREFPNRLQVQLQEHQAVAYWGGDAEQRLVNTFGEVFDANVGEVESEGLPNLNGPDGQAAEVLAMYRTLAPAFEAVDLPMDSLDLSGRGSWSTQLESGASIELGRGSAEEVRQRVGVFLQTLAQVTSRYGRKPDALESADLRHENGYAVRLRGVSTTEAPQRQSAVARPAKPKTVKH